SLSSTDAAAAFGSGVSTLGLTGGYMRKLEESIAVGGEASWVSVSYKDYSASSLSLLAIGHFAFDYHDFNNSYFGLAGLGIGSTLAKYSTSEKSENKVAFRLGGGKRTHITKSIYWRPEIYFEKVDGFDGTLVLRMINLTMIW
ncbi:MAG: hypothetical protein NT027_08080, partial [Proteobacteria bacterium]|nr:hypothetical protein [Pseudomonadota bacterium]